jgi:dTDP-4-dehydrorhamnose 3,5-epimerase
MRTSPTTLDGVRIIEPAVFGDSRGFFLETFHRDRFAEAGLPTEFVQDNRSRSIRSVLRGLHYQLRSPQGKLISVVTGTIFDVAVDIRVSSPQFGQWFGMTLSEDEPRSLWIPPGFAHGFCVLSDSADVTYKCTARYDPSDERGIAWNDPALGIEWPISSPLLSGKDARHPRLEHAQDHLPRFES